MSLLYTCTWCQCEHALPLLPSSPEIPHTRSAGTPSHGDQRDPGIPRLPWSPPGSSHLPVRDASLCSLLLLSCCWFPGRDLRQVSEQGWALGNLGRRRALARGRVEAGIQGVQCPITKTWGAGITLHSPYTAGTSTLRGRGSPHDCRHHTRFPAASQPFCSPSSIYLIINSAITINSWGCCSHVDQSSTVVRAERGHVSSPEGLLSPGINCLGHVHCGCAGPWSPGTSGGSSLIAVAMAPALGVAGTGAKHLFLQCFAVFCSDGAVLSIGGWWCLMHARALEWE